MRYESYRLLQSLLAIIVFASYAKAQTLPTPMPVPAQGAYQNSHVKRNSHLAQPVGLVASVKVNPGNANTVLLKWNQVPQASQYLIRCTQTGITLTIGEVEAREQKGKIVSYEDTFPEGEPLEFTIIAVNATGESLPSARVNITLPLRKPEPPYEVIGVGGNKSVSLRWPNYSPQYRVYRRTGNKPWEISTTTNTNTRTKDNTFTDTRVQNGLSYTYVISGINKAGEGVASRPVTVIPTVVIQTPKTLLARAQTFLRTIGEPITTFSASPLLIPGNQEHYARRWKVFCGQVEFDILDATGQIVYFYRRDRSKEPRKTVNRLNKEQSEQRANAIVLAAGLKSSYTPWKMESSPQDGRNNDNPQWGFAKQRLFQGVPLRDQRLAVLFAVDGKLDILVNRERFADPHGIPTVIAQKDASKAAEKILLARKITGATFATAQLSVVQPNNTYAIVKQSGTVAESRVAWLVTFVRPNPTRAKLIGGEEHTKGEVCIHDTYLEVWIDAKNGTLLGGEVMR
jgi:hypothetical protein